MKHLTLLAMFVVIAVPVFAAVETWKNVSMVDTMCLSKVKDNPDKHTATCLVKCQKSGFGIITEGGTYLKFDEAGNEKALAALKATDKKDHIRVTVSGEKEGETIKVKSLSLD